MWRLSSGGAFGPNSKLYAIPWQALHVGANGDVTTSITKSQLSQSPGFTNSYWPSQGDTRWLSASAGTTSSSAAERDDTEARRPRAHRQRGSRSLRRAPPDKPLRANQDVQMRRVTHLTGIEVKNPDNQDLGDIEDFAIDTSSGHITYDIISVGGVAGIGEKYAAVPSNAVQIQPQTHTATLNATKQTLDSVAFAPSQFPNLSSPDYMARLSKLFPAAPSGGALGYVPSQTPQTQLIADEKSWRCGRSARQGLQSQHGQDDHGNRGERRQLQARERAGGSLPRTTPAGEDLRRQRRDRLCRAELVCGAEQLLRHARRSDQHYRLPDDDPVSNRGPGLRVEEGQPDPGTTG